MDYLEKIAAAFDKNELIQILKQLVQENSENPPGKEAAIARLVQKILKKNGIQSELSWAATSRPNVIAILKGIEKGSKIIFNGHLDTVPVGQGWSEEPFAAAVRDGKLFGRGAADMKSGLAAMIYAAIVLKRMDMPLSGELILFFNVDEEVSNLGMKKFLAGDILADYAIIGEPTGLSICIGHKGCARYSVKTYGTLAHTSSVIRPDNAIYKMAKLIVALESCADDIHKRIDPLMGNASMTVSQIKGGMAVNVVPAQCKIKIDRRTFPGEISSNLLKEIDTCIAAAARPLGIKYKLECYQFVPATVIKKDDIFVRKFQSATKKAYGKKSPVKVFDATCEAPFLSIDKGIPTIIYGPGNLKQAHVKDEYVRLAEVKKAALTLIHFALDLLKGSQ